jgi:N-acetylmuramoyl-L-alanine amidase CwlD
LARLAHRPHRGLARLLGRAALGLGLAGAALVALARPAHAAAYVRLSEIAARYGLRAEVDLISGRQVLTDGKNTIAILPGGWQILVNGRFAPLADRAGSDSGDIILPAAALSFIEQGLGPAIPQAAPAPAPVAPRPRPALAERPEAAPRAASLPAPGSAGTIVIDPGHGGIHTGARGRSGIYEKDINLGVARHVKTLLEERGWRVIMTRAADRELVREINADLDARADMANGAGADAFISIHTNYAENTSAQGFEVYYYAPSRRGAILAREIERSLKAATPDEDRGVKTANFRVIKRARIPAVLVEIGFVSHPPTERRLASDDYRRTLAEAIVRGVEAYRRK